MGAKVAEAFSNRTGSTPGSYVCQFYQRWDGYNCISYNYSYFQPIFSPWTTSTYGDTTTISDPSVGAGQVHTMTFNALSSNIVPDTVYSGTDYSDYGTACYPSYDILKFNFKWSSATNNWVITSTSYYVIYSSGCGGS